MRIVGGWMFLCLVFFPIAPAGAGDPAGLIQSVIQRQMKAFNEDDYPAAYTFASGSIRQRFSRERFEKMVKSGYPQIAKSRLVSFGEITFSNDKQAAVAVVHVTGKDRVTVVAEYQMVLEEGEWKIGGVTIVEEMKTIGLPASFNTDASDGSSPISKDE